MKTLIHFWKKYKILQARWAAVLVSISEAQTAHSHTLSPAVARRVLCNDSYAEEDRIFDSIAKKEF